MIFSSLFLPFELYLLGESSISVAHLNKRERSKSNSNKLQGSGSIVFVSKSRILPAAPDLERPRGTILSSPPVVKGLSSLCVCGKMDYRSELG